MILTTGIASIMVFPVEYQPHFHGIYIENTYGHGETGREGEMYGESNMETSITMCKIDSQREFAVWLRKLK